MIKAYWMSFPGQRTATASSCIHHNNVYMRGLCARKSENGVFRCDTRLQIFLNDSKICEAEVTVTPLINKICKPCLYNIHYVWARKESRLKLFFLMRFPIKRKALASYRMWDTSTVAEN